MENRQGNLWQATAQEKVEATPLSTDLSVDIAIIGGGFTGCSAALAAAGSGASTVLLEANTIGHGGSGRNVGLANAGLWLPPDQIVAQMGEDAGHKLIALLGEAPERVFALIEKHGIQCEPVRNGTLHCAHSPAGLNDLQERHRQGNRFGAPLRLLDATETARRTGSTRFHGALFDPRAGTIQPLAYCRGLVRAATQAGARIHDRTTVSGLSHDGDAWVIRANGHHLRAKALLMATNAYHLGIETPFRPQFMSVYYSQFATDPLPHDLRSEILPGGEGCWDTALVMSSFRVDAAGRLIIGGMGNLEGAGSPVHRAWARRKLRTLFPKAGDLPIRHQWQGRIAMTSDHVPKILEFGPNAYACFGYSGRGIGPGTVFGASAAEALLTGDTSNLPIAPVKHHSEQFAALRSAYYEFGATLTHAVK
ncbi:FAD-binding oxidoreductase [Rhizobium sp. L1K21]|uniref:NAD(P)/FAD-dependent oxidoreductase n=1 Tax=Rhizobium sp. L1K21 TaxID=2954933 RepID=UPI00209333A9|nr:FAD-binding oxidoreductase [Rhizobium sp. L1K21]MCO6188310.1 FAD-binding oxidoreductase [Rhizobium sp. L1K21]